MKASPSILITFRLITLNAISIAPYKGFMITKSTKTTWLPSVKMDFFAMD